MHGLDAAREHRLFIALVHSVDKIPVPGSGRIEIVPESAVHEGIDYVAVRNEQFKLKMVKQGGECPVSEFPRIPL